MVHDLRDEAEQKKAEIKAAQLAVELQQMGQVSDK
jgi:hypothetical protein